MFVVMILAKYMRSFMNLRVDNASIKDYECDCLKHE